MFAADVFDQCHADCQVTRRRVFHCASALTTGIGDAKFRAFARGEFTAIPKPSLLGSYRQLKGLTVPRAVPEIFSREERFEQARNKFPRYRPESAAINSTYAAAGAGRNTFHALPCPAVGPSRAVRLSFHRLGGVHNEIQ